MPEEKQLTKFELNSWGDVDAALREISECEITLNDIEGNMNIEINAAKETATNLSSPFHARVKALETLVKAYVIANKDDMTGKTKVLNFGKVGFRRSSRVSIPTKQIESIIQALKKHGMQDCINTKETINKEVLEKYSDNDIVKVGASKKYDDKFFMETNKAKLGV